MITGLVLSFIFLSQQNLMKQEVWIKYPGMKELVLKFVAPGLWEKHKSELARKVSPSAVEKTIARNGTVHLLW